MEKPEHKKDEADPGTSAAAGKQISNQAHRSIPSADIKTSRLHSATVAVQHTDRPASRNLPGIGKANASAKSGRDSNPNPSPAIKDRGSAGASKVGLKRQTIVSK